MPGSLIVMQVVANNAAPLRGQSAADAPRPAHRDALLRRLRTVAKARFAAHARLSAKGHASNLGLQVANLYTIAIGIFLIQFPASGIVKAHGGVLNYVSLIASVFVQILALIETYRDYGGQARAMHDCALRVNSLSQQLELDQRADTSTLEAYRRAYEHAIRDAATNHEAIDYRAARLDPERWHERTREERWAIVVWQLSYFWHVYGLTGAVLVFPIVAGYLLMQLQLG